MQRPMIRFSFLLLVITQLAAQVPHPNFQMSGTVVNFLTAEPLAHSEVSIGAVEHPDTALQKLLTAADGRFVFTALHPGKYWLAARRNGFERQGYEQHNGYATTAVAVGPGLDSQNLIFRLRPDGSITGRITDKEENEPVWNAQIFLFRRHARSGFRQILKVAETSTDDRGVYHFAHLEAGEYFIVVSGQPWHGPDATVWPPPTGQDLYPHDGAGSELAYPITYYPGVDQSSFASAIGLKEGEKFVADMTLAARPAFRVLVKHLESGTGYPRTAGLRARVFDDWIDPPHLAGQSLLENSFEFVGLVAGKYLLEIEPIAGTARYRSFDLTADTEIDADSAMALSPVRGLVEMNGAWSPPEQPAVLLLNNRTGETASALLSAQGQFSFSSQLLMPGIYSVFVLKDNNSIAGNLLATGAKVEGQTIQLTGSTPVYLRIRLSRCRSTINGKAQRAGKPLSGAMILLVPENAQRNLPLFRLDQSDSDGTFTLHDVLPGRYKLLAIENGWDLEWANSGVLKNYLDHAADVNILSGITYQTTISAD